MRTTVFTSIITSVTTTSATLVFTVISIVYVASSAAATGTYFEPKVISINSSPQLVQSLKSISEGAYWNNNVVLELDSLSCHMDYELPPPQAVANSSSFMAIINSTITIRSNSEYVPVTVLCLKPQNETATYHSTSGLAFINSSVTIKMVNFIGCGTHVSQLSKSVVSLLNSTKNFRYQHNKSAALLFIDCDLSLSFVTIDSSFGFAIIGHNIYSSNFTSINITNSVNKGKQRSNMDIGSGMLVHFTDSKTNLYQRNIFIKNVTFENNFDQTLMYCPFRENINLHHTVKYVLNAAGLTILYTQVRYTVHVYIHGAVLVNNVGQVAGSILLLHYRSLLSSTTLADSMFRDNVVVGCHTGDITGIITGVKHHHQSFPFYFRNLHFDHKGLAPLKHAHGSSLINIDMQYSNANINVEIEKVYFSLVPKPGSEGNCVRIENHQSKKGSINVTLSSITAINNTNIQHKYKLPQSLFYFENIQNVSFTGIGTFDNNQGSVIHAQDSNVYLYEKQTFTNNTAENGAAIKVEGNGLLYFRKGLRATFIGNRALFSAGAIYVDSYVYRQCGMQFEDNQKSVFIFLDNLGTTAGNSVFLKPVYNCAHDGYYHASWIHRYINYLSLQSSSLNNQTVNTLLELSTIPKIINVFSVMNDKQVSLIYTKQLRKYPGQIFSLFIEVHDSDDRHAYTFINTEIFIDNDVGSESLSVHSVWLQQTEGNIAYEGIEKNSMNLSIHTSTKQSRNAVLAFSIPKIYTRSVKVHILPCPLGFTLEMPSGSCTCAELISKQLPGTECSIHNDAIISIPNSTNPWMGLVYITTNDTSNDTTSNAVFAVSDICPKSYCNNDPFNRYLVKSINNSFMLTSNVSESITVPYCLGNRHGILCGKCNKDYSMVLGSDHCQQCSNLWLLIIIVHGILGPFLIWLLYILNLTLTNGMLNGAIFYVQVTKAGVLESMSVYSTQHKTLQEFFRICRLMLSILNMNHFFPTCFYDGMNQLWKTGLNLIFSFYLLLIVVVIIVISRYSTWLSNRTSHSSVQVLVTVVHLSFSKLLLALIDVFTPATVHVSNTSTPLRVWYWDGTVQYMGPSHYPLVIFTSITVSLMVVPYLGLLILGKPLIKYSKRANFYIRPVYEAIHAPYQDDKHYWFVGRMMLLITVYILYVIFRTNSYSTFCLIVSTLLCIFTVTQALSHPFKDILLNFLDCWFMINITLVFNTLGEHVSLGISITFNTVAIVLALLTIVGIFLYHVMVVTRCGKRLYKRVLNMELTESCIMRFRKKKVQHSMTTIETYYGSCNQYREPLILAVEDDEGQSL